MVKDASAKAVIHTGDFGFLDGASPTRMAARILRHILSYSPLLDSSTRASALALAHGPELFKLLDPEPSKPSSFKLSQLGSLLKGEIKFSVPVYTVYGPVEDVRVLEKFRTGEFEVENLMILDEALTRSLEVGGVKLRLFGLGGGVTMHKIFDNGEGNATIAGGGGTVWATALQIGELVDTAEKVFDPTETRVLVTHGAIGREGLLSQLAMVLKADLTISGSLHFRVVGSFNEFGVHSDIDSFRAKLSKSRNSFWDVYESAKAQLDKSIAADQKEFLQKALQVAQKSPSPKGEDDDQHWKNRWNWSLSEAAYGHMVMSIKDGRVSSETYSQGLNFGYRRHKAAAQPSTHSNASIAPSSSTRPEVVVPARPIAPPAQVPSTESPAASVKTVAPIAAPVTSPAVIPRSTPPTAPAANANAPPARTERKTSNRFENAESKEPWVKPGADAVDRNGKRRKNGKEGPDGVKSPPYKKELTSKPVATKPDADKENVPEVKEGKPDEESKETEATATTEGTETKANGERPVKNPFNPHTLYVKGLPLDCTSDQLKSAWKEDIREKMTRIKIPTDIAGKPKRFAYIEFANEEDVQSALNTHEEILNGSTINVSVSNPPVSSGPGGGFRGRGGFGMRGRGGFGGSRGSFRGGAPKAAPTTAASGAGW